VRRPPIPITIGEAALTEPQRPNSATAEIEQAMTGNMRRFIPSSILFPLNLANRSTRPSGAKHRSAVMEAYNMAPMDGIAGYAR
jgi:hypothetical protein